MIPLFDAARMRRLDRHAIEVVGLPGAVLMETAGRGAVFHLLEAYGEAARSGVCVVVCGTGNNGGDGFVAARSLLGAGCAVEALLVGRREAVAGDAALHLDAFVASGGSLTQAVGAPAGAAKKILDSAVLLVDALFGTGLSRPVTGAAAAWIEAMNGRGVPVVALDIPSGVSADTGAVLGAAARASLTVTFGQRKKGLYLHPGASRAGRVEVVDIGIPRDAAAREAPDLFLLEEKDFAGIFRRPVEAHKGFFGHVALLAGGRGKMGAASLAATAALRAGAGLVTAAFPSGLLAEARFMPEIMTQALPGEGPEGLEWCPASIDAAAALLSGADAVVAGPGMGLSASAQLAFFRLLGVKGLPPLVLDADALTLLSRAEGKKPRLDPRTVLTPHPGEAARLLGGTAAAVQEDRPAAAAALAKKFGCVVALKGAGTLIAAPGEPLRLVSAGNPGMATAGSGDVLSGVAGAFAARGLPSGLAADAAVYAHAVAGDRAALEVGQESLIASDILHALPHALRPLAGRA